MPLNHKSEKKKRSTWAKGSWRVWTFNRYKYSGRHLSLPSEGPFLTFKDPEPEILNPKPKTLLVYIRWEHPNLSPSRSKKILVSAAAAESPQKTGAHAPAGGLPKECQGEGFRAFRVQGLGLGHRVWGFGFRVLGLRFGI